MTNPSYNICVFGESGCGKTTFVRRVTKGDYSTTYTPTSSPILTIETVRIVNLNREEKRIQLNFWDIPENKCTSNLLERADLVIVMIDPLNPNVDPNKWVQLVRKYNLKLPILLISSKSDLKTVSSAYIKFITHQISSKDDINLDSLLLCLIRILTKQGDIRIVEDNKLEVVRCPIYPDGNYPNPKL